MTRRSGGISLSTAGVLMLLLGMGCPLPSDNTRRFERGETRVIVTGVQDKHLELFRAGAALPECRPVAGIEADELWLPPGAYFLKVPLPGTTLFYPVPLTGYRSGPDADGSFLVVVRPPPGARPPTLLPDLPPYCFIPSGTFLLGDRRNAREPHAVWLSGYFLAPYEVSNEEFRAFLNAADGYGDDRNWTDEGTAWRRSSSSQCTARFAPGEEDYGRFGAPDKPVSRICWYEAQAYCAWLTRTLGRGRWQYVLPSEAEWEKAARGPDGFEYALGNIISDDQAGWYNWRKNPGARETVIGWKSTPERFSPNRYGCYHLTGNVLEWTCSTDRPYNREHPYADDDRNAVAAPGQRVARGGSWYSASIAYLSNAYRDAFLRSHTSIELGFRVAVHPLP